jgi:hypothetical protein
MEASELIQHAAPDLGIEGRQRFVQQQYLGTDRQGAGDGHALLLPAAQLTRIAAGEILHPHHAQALANLRLNIGPRRAPGIQAESHVFFDPHMGKQRIVLDHHSNAALVGRQVRHIALADPDAPADRAGQRPHGPERSGLGGDGGADEG